MSEDVGNDTTNSMYQLATEPTFIDRSQEVEQEISWEVQDGETPPLPIEQPEEIKEENLPESDNEDPENHLEDDAETEESEKKKKKNRTSEKTRIAKLTRELRQAQSMTHDVLTRNQYLESKLSQKDKEVMTSQENYLSAQKERVKKYLTDALEEGDSSKIAEAQDLLSQYNAEILLLSRQTTKENVPYQPSIPQSYDGHSYQEPIDNEYKDIGNEWIENTPWADKNSDSFDIDLYQEADEYSAKLMKKYKIAGKNDEIGSRDFFNEITRYMNSKYEIEDNTSQVSSPQVSRDKMQMKTHKSPPVGTVNRGGIQGQTLTKSKDMVLTAEQKETAYSLRGFVRDPKTGEKITDNRMLEEIYKRNLMRGNG